MSNWTVACAILYTSDKAMTEATHKLSAASWTEMVDAHEQLQAINAAREVAIHYVKRIV